MRGKENVKDIQKGISVLYEKEARKAGKDRAPRRVKRKQIPRKNVNRTFKVT